MHIGECINVVRVLAEGPIYLCLFVSMYVNRQILCL